MRTSSAENPIALAPGRPGPSGLPDAPEFAAPTVASRLRAVAPDPLLVMRLGLLLVCLAVMARTEADPDLWGHVRFGADIVAAQSVPRVDVYSFTSDGTALYDALFGSLHTLKMVEGRRAIVVVTDGMDEDRTSKRPREPAAPVHDQLYLHQLHARWALAQRGNSRAAPHVIVTGRQGYDAPAR
jgi:hypothetical protein